MVGQMDSKNSRVTFVTKIIFWRTFVIITSCFNVIRDNTKLEGQFTGIGQSSPASFIVLHQISSTYFIILTHELSEEKSAKFDRVDHLWPHKAGD